MDDPRPLLTVNTLCAPLWSLGVHRDEGEQIREELLNLPIAARMAFFTNVASILLIGAMVCNLITNEDVLGPSQPPCPALPSLLPPLHSLPRPPHPPRPPLLLPDPLRRHVAH